MVYPPFFGLRQSVSQHSLAESTLIDTGSEDARGKITAYVFGIDCNTQVKALLSSGRACRQVRRSEPLLSALQRNDAEITGQAAGVTHTR